MDVWIRIGLEVIGWAGLAQGAIGYVSFFWGEGTKWDDEVPKKRDVDSLVVISTFALAGVIILTGKYMVAA